MSECIRSCFSGGKKEKERPLVRSPVAEWSPTGDCQTGLTRDPVERALGQSDRFSRARAWDITIIAHFPPQQVWWGRREENVLCAMTVAA